MISPALPGFASHLAGRACPIDTIPPKEKLRDRHRHEFDGAVHHGFAFAGGDPDLSGHYRPAERRCRLEGSAERRATPIGPVS